VQIRGRSKLQGWQFKSARSRDDLVVAVSFLLRWHVSNWFAYTSEGNTRDSALANQHRTCPHDTKTRLLEGSGPGQHRCARMMRASFQQRLETED
jgi:hypothetical protein